MKILAIALVVLAASTAPAFADPVSIGSFIISSLLSVGAGGLLPVVSAATIGNAVIGAAIIGASLLSSVLGRAPKINPGDFKSTFETGDSSEIRAVGRVRVGGLKAFGNTQGGTNRYRLLCHTRGKVSAVEEHYLGGREVTVESDGAVSSPPWSKPGGAWVYIKSKVGDGTETAWSELVAAFPTLWTSAHRVRGIAQSLVQYISPGFGSTESQEEFQKLYQSGPPEYERVQRSEPVYDPRDGGQSATTESTWVYDDNGPLCAAHILRSYPSLVVADFDYSGIATEATKAEVSVTTLTGTEERSRCWGMWASETPRGDVMDQVLRSIGAEIVPTDDNTFNVRLIDDVRTPEITFTAKHIIDLQWHSGPESVERPNICRVKYYSPERNYEMTEIDLTGISWARNQDEIDAVGEQIMDIDLPFCPSASQAQRIARRLFALARADAGLVKLNFAGLAAWGLSVADIELPDLEVTETCAIGSPRINDDEGTVEIPFVVWPTLAAWNPATMEAPAPDPIPDMAYEAVLETPVAPSEAAVVQYLAGGYETRVRFTTVAGATQTELVYRTYTAGEPNPFDAITNIYSGTGSTRYGYEAVNTDGEELDFKVRFFDDEDEGSYYSDVLNFDPLAFDNTTPAAPAMGLGIDNETITVTATIGGTEMRVSDVSIEMRREVTAGMGDYGPWEAAGAGPIRPGQQVVGSKNYAFVIPLMADGAKVQVRAAARVSDGSFGPFATGEVTYDEPPP